MEYLTLYLSHCAIRPTRLCFLSASYVMPSRSGMRTSWMAVRSLSVGLPVKGMKCTEASAKRAVIAPGFILDDGMGGQVDVKYVVTVWGSRQHCVCAGL